MRLFSGDPLLDGALQTEAAALGKAKVHFDIAPGVSTLTGVPAYAGIGLLGGKAREVRVVDADDPGVEWALHADPRVTLVVLNGADRAVEVARALTAAGRATGTPIAITRGGTTVEQRTITSTLGDVAAAVKAAKQAGPGLVVIGETVGNRDKLSWFETKPLFGWRVLVPRTKEQAGALSEQLTRYGAVRVEVPTISVEPPRTPQQMERAITRSGLRPLPVGRVHHRQRGARGAREVRGVRPRRPRVRRPQGRRRRRADRRGADRVRRPPRPRAQRRAVAARACSRTVPEYDAVFDPINRVFLPRADIATETLVAGLDRARLGGRGRHGVPHRARGTAGGRDPRGDQDRRLRRGAVHLVEHGAQPGRHRRQAARHHGRRVHRPGDGEDRRGARPARRRARRDPVGRGAGRGARRARRLAAARGASRHGESVWRPSKRRGGARRKAT